MTDELSIFEERDIENDLPSPAASSIMSLPSPGPALIDSSPPSNQTSLPPVKSFSE